jgi:mannose-6-phosphate isomerase-like protein (cupin superfamily)
MTLPAIHRVVTGHDEQGKAIVVSDGPVPNVVKVEAIPGTLFHEVWSTEGAPARVDRSSTDPSLGPVKLPPPRHGTRIRFVDIPPDTEDYLANGAQRMQSAFSAVGDPGASTVKAHSPHPLMHRTETIDYGIVIDGEIVLVLDDSEVPLSAGAVVVQRGTNHAWANRSGKTCRLAFILVDGAFDPELKTSLEAFDRGG